MLYKSEGLTDLLIIHKAINVFFFFHCFECQFSFKSKNLCGKVVIKKKVCQIYIRFSKILAKRKPTITRIYEFN